MIESALDQLRTLLRPHAGWYALLAAVMLTVMGLIAIDTVAPDEARGQLLVSLPIALAVMFICLLPHPRMLGHASYLIFALSLFLLAFLLIPGVPHALVPERNGARSWINLGVMSIQPSELGKIAFVLSLAWYCRYRSSYRSLRGLLAPFAIMFVPVVLILREPDLGTAMLFAPTLFVMLVAAGAKLRHMFTLAAIGIVAVGLNVAVIAIDPPHAANPKLHWMHVLAPHQEKRIAAMFWPQRYQRHEAFQPIVAQRMVGSGGIAGLGGDQAGVLIRFNRLPEPHNDMIFSVVAARWGLCGAAAVVGLYLVLTGSFLLAAVRIKEPFARLSVVGFAAMFFTQAAINMAVNVGLFPTTGITLPFVSDGGTSLLASFAMVGLMINFAARRPQILTRPSFEFDHADAIFQ